MTPSFRASSSGSSTSPASLWYQKGLCFSCTQCGDCCRHEEGYVWVTRPQVLKIGRFLGLDEETTMARYIRRVGRRLSLIEKANLDCIFWDQGCTIYPVRPTQCRNYPFWPENLASPEDWEEVASCCPGVGHGRRYDVEEICSLAKGRGETGRPGDNAT